MPLLRRRPRLLPAVAAALVCGGAAAAAVLLLGNQGITATVSTRVLTDVYARLKPHPRLVEPVAGDTAGVATEVQVPGAAPNPRAVEPRAGGGPPSDAEVRRQLAELRRA